MGAGKLFTILLGVSPVVAIILYFTMNKQDEIAKSIDTQLIQMSEQDLEFDRDFAMDQKSFATTDKEKKHYEKVVENKETAIQDIAFKKEAAEQAKQAASRRLESNLEDIDKELSNLDESEFNF